MNQSASWQFQIFNFPVRVHISFFFIALLLGLQSGNAIYLLLWVAIVFFSVLLHELGHAFVSQYYGRSPRIELHSMGGLTISQRSSILSYPQEILISFSGALFGFIFAGVVYALLRMFGPVTNQYLGFLVGQLLWVNIGWGIINLLPILPLDGGHIMRELVHWLKNPHDERTPLRISIGFGILIIIALLFFFRGGGLYLALLVGWMTYNNYTALRRGYWSDSLY